MHGTGWRARGWGWARPVAAVAVQAALLAACGRTTGVQVATIPPPQPPPPAHAAAVFQGKVTEVDPTAGQFTVAVHLVWAPQIQAVDEERRVAVAARTRWPAHVDLASLHPGLDVQVTAADTVPGPDGIWIAAEVQLFDLE